MGSDICVCGEPIDEHEREPDVLGLIDGSCRLEGMEREASGHSTMCPSFCWAAQTFLKKHRAVWRRHPEMTLDEICVELGTAGAGSDATVVPFPKRWTIDEESDGRLI